MKKQTSPNLKRKPLRRTVGSKPSKKQIPGLRPHHMSLALLALLGIGWAGILLLVQPTLRSEAAGCTVTDKLVNPCRPWLGAAVNNYPQVAEDTKAQILYHEQRIGRQLDIAHTYHPVGSNRLNDTDKYFATRSGTYLFTNWKPASKWVDAAGGNGTVNASIDQMAASIASVAPKKIFLTLNHEPENDVSGGANCPTFKGSAGTPADYRQMWRNVRNRFSQAGASNVVWVMDYMNYKPWECMINDLYPGDDLVDWVMFNAYGQGAETWNTKVGQFYTFLTNNSNGSHNYLSKPWGIVEWSYKNGSVAAHSAYFDQVKTSLEANTFPKLQAYMVFDARHKGSDTEISYRVGYDDNNNYSADQSAHYKALANSPRLTGDGGQPAPPPAPAKDTAPPTIALTSPANNAAVSGVIQVQGTASDNVGVKAITMRVDDTYIATDATPPYSITLDTTHYSDGLHTIVLRAFDPANNMGESNRIIVQIKNKSGSTASTSPPPESMQQASSIAADTSSTPATPIAVGGLVIVNSSKPGSSVIVYVDGKRQDNNTVNANELPNGTHKIIIFEDGQPVAAYVRVQNPWPLAVINNVRVNAVLYGVASSVAVILAAAWIGRSYVFGLTSRREHRITVRQRDPRRMLR